GDDTATARVERRGKALDRPALAGRVAPLEDEHDLLAGRLDPVLHLDQLHVQFGELLVVLLALQLLAVRFVIDDVLLCFLLAVFFPHGVPLSWWKAYESEHTGRRGGLHGILPRWPLFWIGRR